MFFLSTLTAAASESSVSLPAAPSGAIQAVLPEFCANRPGGVRIGGVPVFSYDTDEGLTLGLMGQRFDYRTNCSVPFRNLVTFKGSYATLGERILEAEYQQTGVSSWNLRSLTSLSYVENSHQPYYGVGPDTTYDPSLDAEEYYRFTQKEIQLTNSVRKKITGTRLEGQLGAEVTGTSYSPTRGNSRFVDDFGEVKQSFVTTRVSLKGVWENRDSEFTPSKGTYGAMGFTYAPESLGNYGKSWARGEGDYRVYSPLISGRRLWLANQIRYTGTTDETPISEKARLGSVGTLRGLPYARYLGNHSVGFRTDLRSMWFSAHVLDLPFKLGTGIFFDTGMVSDRLSDLPDERLHHSYGISIFGSYFTDDFLGSADLGFSEGQTVFYVRLGHPF